MTARPPGRFPSRSWYRCTSPALDLTLVAIPKNACTAQKCFLAEAEGHRFDPPRTVHAGARDLLRGPVASRIVTFVRDPAERLASAYRNKLLRPRLNLPALSAIEGHARMRGHALERDIAIECADASREVLVSSDLDLDRGLTFREFVTYVCGTPDEDLDAHWRSQSWFAEGEVVRLESIADVLNAYAPFEFRAPTTGSPGTPTGEDADVPSSRLRTTTASRLYTPDLLSMVEARFSDDRALRRSAAPRP